MKRRILRAVGWAVFALLFAALLAGGWGYARLRGALAALDGAVPVRGLAAPVTVARDGIGYPLLRGRTREDVARATGFVHAQERYFQMDLLRRRAAGELAELVGAAALPVDRATRRHRFRALAREVVARATPRQRAVLEAYAAGANAGLAALAAPPFEYLLLRGEPAPWRIEDSALVLLAMFIDLHGETGSRDAVMGALHDGLPGPLFELLAARGTEWDAPLAGPRIETPPLPGPEVLDLRAPSADRPGGGAPGGPGAGRPGAGGGGSGGAVRDGLAPGSNAWAVSGAHSAHGGALVANDMHLGLAVPNIWFRAALAWDGDGSAAAPAGRVAGVTLPGTPFVVAGSNGRVAWGFTNSYGDWQDLVVLEPDPADPARYLAPGGARPFTIDREVIRVARGADEVLGVRGTIWGPVIDRDGRGRERALAWTAHHVEAVNLGLGELEEAGGLEAALDVANRAGIPPQNFQCADATGRIGWTVAGVLPRRFGLDGRVPASWADGKRGWDGFRAPGETPRIVDPPSGRIWTANARTVDGEPLARLGDGGYALGARARQIRDDLLARDTFTERDLLAIQLDDRAAFLERWRALLLETLDRAPRGEGRDDARASRRAEVRRLVAAWGGRATVDAVGYRLVRAWRLSVRDRALAPLLAGARRLRPQLSAGDLEQAEGALWRLVTERPPHLLDPREGSWDRLLLAALDDALDALPGGGAALAARTWGERNTAEIHHPLSRAVPALARFLDMPAEPLPGGDAMPRVQSPSFGASERMVVSPGREAEGILHAPGGQSGHPLSPYYRAGHEAWVRGEPTPFLPGPPRHTLTLLPAAP